jgi:hypothetical protein
LVFVDTSFKQQVLPEISDFPLPKLWISKIRRAETRPFERGNGEINLRRRGARTMIRSARKSNKMIQKQLASSANGAVLSPFRARTAPSGILPGVGAGVAGPFFLPQKLPRMRFGLYAVTSRSLLAERILTAAARGERDPDRLRAQAHSERTDLKIAS